MFSYSPYSPFDRTDADYLCALADERAARAQYQAALRAQEEAQARAARAARARQAAAPYSSFLDDDDYDGYTSGYVDYDAARRRAFLEEQRRAVLEEQRRAELERARLEEQRRKLIEEERLRRLLAEEQRQREQQFAFDPLSQAFGWRAPRTEDEGLVCRRAARPDVAD